MDRLKELKKIRGTTLSCMIMVLLFAIFADGFLSMYSISVILKNTSILMTAAFAMTIAIVLGKVDVSIGAVMSLSAVVTGMALRSGMPLLPAVLAGLTVGFFIGVINGVFIAKLKFNYWLSTFAMMGIAKGIALGWTQGKTVSKLNDNFSALGNGDFLGIYYITWIAAGVLLLMYILTKKTKYGYDLYASGNSEAASALSGIHVDRVIMKTYAIGGTLAALAGILLASKSNAANPTIGDSYAFDSIAAAIIGGTPFVGGKGGILGTVLGAFLLTSLKHGLSLLGLTSLQQMAIIGIFIMIIIILDTMRENRVAIEEKRRRFEDDE